MDVLYYPRRAHRAHASRKGRREETSGNDVEEKRRGNSNRVATYCLVTKPV